MFMTKNFNEVLDILNKAFPELLAVDSAEFAERYKPENGMWFKGSEGGLAPDGLPLFDYYMEFGIHRDTDGVHPKLNNLLRKHGFYPEPYDAGTLMAGIL
jgi:hypothetical protein|tara:strand:- start:186 stop:485 length:300 start_codon:yes stop_codon:yes gene_type:complete